MQIGFIVVGVALIVIGLLHEYSWIKRQNGKMKKGIVIGNIENITVEGESYHPIIKFNHAGADYEFTSEYGNAFKPITEGTEVDVFVPDNPYDAEWHSEANRHVITVACSLIGLLFIFVAVNFEK